MKSLHFVTVMNLAALTLGGAAASGCEETQDAIDANVIGKVVLDEEPVQGVGVRIVDQNDAQQTTNTDIQGDYRFAVLPGEVTVRLIRGLPDDAECAPNTEQDVIAPPIAEDPIEVDFACETGSGGAGGAGGEGGKGGAGGSGGSVTPGTGGAGGTGGMVALPGFDSCSSCECDPFVADSCPPGDTCAVWFVDSPSGQKVVALDGSDGKQATQCLGPDQIAPNPVGFACILVGDGRGFFTSPCNQNGVCFEGTCLRNCNSETGASVCTGQNESCNFRFGDVDYGACE